MTQSRNSIVFFPSKEGSENVSFFARNSSLVLPRYQPCLRLMGAEKYRTSDQREEMSEIQCKVSMRASPTRCKSPGSHGYLWEKCPFPEKSEFVQKAREACQLVCDVMMLDGCVS